MINQQDQLAKEGCLSLKNTLQVILYILKQDAAMSALTLYTLIIDIIYLHEEKVNLQSDLIHSLYIMVLLFVPAIVLLQVSISYYKDQFKEHHSCTDIILKIALFPLLYGFFYLKGYKWYEKQKKQKNKKCQQIEQYKEDCIILGLVLQMPIIGIEFWKDLFCIYVLVLVNSDKWSAISIAALIGNVLMWIMSVLNGISFHYHFKQFVQELQQQKERLENNQLNEGNQ